MKTNKRTVTLNKPIYIGACVLDLSKLLMYKFHYDTMKVRYPEALMMTTDTDSLLYYVKTDNLYKDIKQDPFIQKQIEFSNYPKNHDLEDGWKPEWVLWTGPKFPLGDATPLRDMDCGRVVVSVVQLGS